MPFSRPLPRNLALLVLGLVGGVALERTLEPFVHESGLRMEPPPCFEIGAPFHHRFRARCVERLNTPRGPVPFSINGDGLRDQERLAILRQPRRVLVLGDSFVEGWWMTAEQALPATLGAQFPGTYFVNAGLRSTGPLMQAARLPRLLRAYQPRGVLWALNDTDAADDRVACSLLRDPRAPAERMEFSVDDFSPEGWRARAATWLGASPMARRLRAQAYARKWDELARGERGLACGACRGIEEVARVAREAHVPLVAAYLPSGRATGASVYAGEKKPREEILACLRGAGVPVTVVSAPDPADALFWENDFHLNPEGNVFVAEKLTPSLSGFVSPK